MEQIQKAKRKILRKIQDVRNTGEDWKIITKEGIYKNQEEIINTLKKGEINSMDIFL